MFDIFCLADVKSNLLRLISSSPSSNVASIASGINLRTGPPAGSKQTEMARTVFFTLTVFLRILARKPTKRNCFFLTTSYRPRNDLTALSDVMGMYGSLKLSLVFNLDPSQLSLK